MSFLPLTQEEINELIDEVIERNTVSFIKNSPKSSSIDKKEEKMNINENQAADICDKFLKVKGWEIINYENYSKNGLRPLLLQKSDKKNLYLFDNYSSLLDDILIIIKNDLENNNGWTNSFYLTLEDIDILKLYKYFENELVDRNKGAYLEELKSADLG